jgi:hypothetical protein
LHFKEQQISLSTLVLLPLMESTPSVKRSEQNQKSLSSPPIEIKDG